MRNIVELLQHAAGKWRDKVYFEEENEKITFGETYTLAKKIATAVAKIAQPNTPVVVLSQKCVQTPAYFLGVLMAGCFYVPLGTESPAARCNHILETVGAKILLTDIKSQQHLDGLDFAGEVIIADKCTKIDEALVANRCNAIVNTDPQTVIFTSGSTGKPKGAITPHAGVADVATAFANVFELGAGTVLGSQTPTEYDAFNRDLVVPLVCGGRSIIIPRHFFTEPQKLFAYLKTKKVNTICWTASVFAMFHDLDVFATIAPPKLDRVFFIGSIMKSKVYDYLRKYLPNTTLIHHYGPTEVTGTSTYFITDKNADYGAGIPIGKAFANRRVFLHDDEIHIGGLGVGKGYFGNVEKTAEVFIQNPTHNNYVDIVYKTGDMGKLDKDGNLIFVGRRDRQIKHMGHRIELGEIETIATLIAGVGEAVCVFAPEKTLLAIFYTGTATEREVALTLRDKLPAYMIPRRYIRLEKMPHLFNGKIDMQSLLKTL